MINPYSPFQCLQRPNVVSHFWNDRTGWFLFIAEICALTLLVLRIATDSIALVISVICLISMFRASVQPNQAKLTLSLTGSLVCFYFSLRIVMVNGNELGDEFSLVPLLGTVAALSTLITATMGFTMVVPARQVSYGFFLQQGLLISLLFMFSMENNLWNYTIDSDFKKIIFTTTLLVLFLNLSSILYGRTKIHVYAISLAALLAVVTEVLEQSTRLAIKSNLVSYVMLLACFITYSSNVFLDQVRDSNE